MSKLHEVIMAGIDTFCDREGLVVDWEESDVERLAWEIHYKLEEEFLKDGNDLANLLFQMGQVATQAGEPVPTLGGKVTRISKRVKDDEPHLWRKNEHGRTQIVDAKTGKVIGEQG